MNDYRSWRAEYQAMCPPPGPLDQFVVLLINGRRLRFQPVTDYEQLREAAERLARDHRCQVKVLPMTGAELMAFYNVVPDAVPGQPMDAEFRQQAVRNFMDVLRTSPQPRDRADALNMLKKMGALNES